MEHTPILNIQNLRVAFSSNSGLNEVLHGISYNLFPNEILGIVGESGSGKSVASLAIMGLLPLNKSSISTGEIIFKNSDLLRYSQKEMEALRGQKIAMIFQEPMSALNPSMCLRNTSGRNSIATHNHYTKSSENRSVTFVCCGKNPST